MKGCLQAIGAIAVLIFFVFVLNVVRSCGSLYETNPSSPAPPTSSVRETSPSVAPVSPPSTTTADLTPPIVQFPSTIGRTTYNPQSTELASANFSWFYGGQWNWELKIPVALYEYYQQLPRPPTRNYSVYVTNSLDDPYISLLVDMIKNAAKEQGYNEYQTVELAIAFVQSLPYTVDSVTSPYDEYPRYPVETLMDRGGDCEDTSILLASIIDKLGYGVVLINLPEHLAVGVAGGDNIYGTYWEYQGSKYYYIETTGQGWEIGQLPDEYKNSGASIFTLAPVPILSHEGGIRGNGYFADVEITVSNIGTAPANGVTVFAGFDAGDRKVWNPQRSEPFTIGVYGKTTVKMSLRFPLGERTRLIVQIWIYDKVADESYTDWFNTY